MTTQTTSPFSARNRGATKLIDDDFPDSAREGLQHLLREAVEEHYLPDCVVVVRELRRIARTSTLNYDNSHTYDTAWAWTQIYSELTCLDWEKAYDFCERIYSHLTQDVQHYMLDERTITTKAQAQAFFAEELQRLFEEESLGYEFRDGLVQKRGKPHTTDQVHKAERTLVDQRLDAARMHFSKALGYFRDRKKPDYANTVKEAVCAVEAAAKELFAQSNAKTLGEFINWAVSEKQNLVPKMIGQTFIGLYGFRGSGEGVTHGATSGGAVTAELSEYVLGVAASQILLLAELARNNEEPPF